MLKFSIEEINSEVYKSNGKIAEELSELLAEDEPERISDFREFWTNWFVFRFPGKRITIVAREIVDSSPFSYEGRIIGVVRLWQSPYCDNKWLIEGLQVSHSKRRNGIGKALIEYSINLLHKHQVKEVFSHIDYRNTPSIALHKEIGFYKLSRGSINSWGEYRKHIDEYCININE
jgi:ribosomal protein S18 acetylase RimI-like enzyme